MAKNSEDPRSDEELMCSYQQGDLLAFQALYSRHSSKVFGFLKLRMKSSEKAQDVFQMTFLKLHQARHQYDPSLPFLPWLFTVTKSVMLDFVRKESSRKEDFNEDAIENAILTEESTPEVNLSSLSESQKLAVELRYYEDLSFEEIAQRLETTPANARQIISRGIKALRDVLKGGSK